MQYIFYKVMNSIEKSDLILKDKDKATILEKHQHLGRLNQLMYAIFQFPTKQYFFSK